MTGSRDRGERAGWSERRVFFLTPQVMDNDLRAGTYPATHVVCVVIDEAHKAPGRHAYGEVIKQLCRSTRRFRVLALTATPGDDATAVQNVINNTLAAHIELRSEESLDIRPYVHRRSTRVVVVRQSPELKQIRRSFLEILNERIGRLVGAGVFFIRNAEQASRYQLLQAMRKLQASPPPHLIRQPLRQGQAMSDFFAAITLAHAFELLDARPCLLPGAPEQRLRGGQEQQQATAGAAASAQYPGRCGVRLIELLGRVRATRPTRWARRTRS